MIRNRLLRRGIFAGMLHGVWLSRRRQHGARHRRSTTTVAAAQGTRSSCHRRPCRRASRARTIFCATPDGQRKGTNTRSGSSRAAGSWASPPVHSRRTGSAQQPRHRRPAGKYRHHQGPGTATSRCTTAAGSSSTTSSTGTPRAAVRTPQSDEGDRAQPERGRPDRHRPRSLGSRRPAERASLTRCSTSRRRSSSRSISSSTIRSRSTRAISGPSTP